MKAEMSQLEKVFVYLIKASHFWANTMTFTDFTHHLFMEEGATLKTDKGSVWEWERLKTDKKYTSLSLTSCQSFQQEPFPNKSTFSTIIVLLI
jgi:hypothetical protein